MKESPINVGGKINEFLKLQTIFCSVSVQMLVKKLEHTRESLKEHVILWYEDIKRA